MDEVSLATNSSSEKNFALRMQAFEPELYFFKISDGLHQAFDVRVVD